MCFQFGIERGLGFERRNLCGSKNGRSSRMCADTPDGCVKFNKVDSPFVPSTLNQEEPAIGRQLLWGWLHKRTGSGASALVDGGVIINGSAGEEVGGGDSTSGGQLTVLINQSAVIAQQAGGVLDSLAVDQMGYGAVLDLKAHNDLVGKLGFIGKVQNAVDKRQTRTLTIGQHMGTVAPVVGYGIELGGFDLAVGDLRVSQSDLCAVPDDDPVGRDGFSLAASEPCQTDTISLRFDEVNDINCKSVLNHAVCRWRN